MPQQQIEYKSVYGLELQSNSFKPREGALEKADNIVISQDDIYLKRRGFKDFVDPGATTIKKLTSFQNKFLGISDGTTTNKVQVYNQNSVTGDYTSTTNLVNETGLTWAASTNKPRTVESNGNLYFTTDNAVIKLESVSGSVLRAGIDQATDLQVFRTVFAGQESFLTPNSQVGYRILFGRKDANQNTILGAPSEFAIITNSVVASSAVDVTATPTVKVTTTSAHPFTVTGSPTQFVFITGANGSGISDGVYQLTNVPDTTHFWFSVTPNTATSVTSLSWGSYKNTKLEFDLPDQIQSTDYIYQIYRTGASADITIEPDESELQLVDELNVTADDITHGFITYYDITPDILRGAFLYTNPNTGEPRGIAEANVRPPTCKDTDVFKNAVFYANPTSLYRLSLALVSSTTVTMPDAATFTIKTTSNTNTRTYVLSNKVGNNIVQATSVVTALNLVTVNYTAHGFSSGDTISVIEAVDSNEAQITILTPGSYVIAVTTANQFTFAVVGTPATPASLSFAGLLTTSGSRYVHVTQSDSGSTTATVSSAIDATARDIVRAINRDSTGDAIAFYTSGPDDVPGKMVIQSKTTSTNFKFNSATAAILDSFLPPLTASSASVIGSRDSESGVLYVAKVGQPEAVPLANKITVGSKTADILRIKALKDSLIIIKTDGVYRLNGSDINSYSVTILDSTITCKASDSVDVLNNQVFLLSEQGFVSISETAAQIVSRQIEPLLTSIVGKIGTAPAVTTTGDSLCEAQTHAVSYESERLYICTTLSPNALTTDVASRVYVFNQLTNAWTIWDTVFTDAYNNPKDDRIFYIDMDNVILREKKNQDRLDYSDDEFDAIVTSVPSATTAVLSITGGDAEVGDVFVANSVLHRITGKSGQLYTFARPHGLAVNDTGIIYSSITSVIRTAPLTGGDTSRMKQFSEFKATFRNGSACSVMETYFLTDDVAGSTTTAWQSAVNGSTDGWGDPPWGQFPWGLEEGTNQTFETNAAQAMRLWIPLETQRATFIQAHMEHAAAAENIAMQSIAYTARIYEQRTTK